MVRNGENSVTRCIGTSSWSYSSVKRAATFTVGWNFRPLPMLRRKPLRCSSVGDWIAPPHTKTCSARIVIGFRRAVGMRDAGPGADDAAVAPLEVG